MTRLIDADKLKECAIACNIHNGTLTDLCVPLYQINNAPTIEVPENAVNCVLTMFGKCSYNKTGCSDCEIKDKIRKALNERTQGKWIKIFDNPYTNGYVCPFCGHKIQVTEKFLPKVTECEVCGAKMDGKEAEE